MKKSRFNHNKPTVISTVLLCLLLAAVMAPFYIMLVGAFKPNASLITIPADLIPVKGFTLKNIQIVFEKSEILLWLKNSMIVSVSVAIATAFIGVTAGYAFAKINFKGKNILFMVVMATMMMPCFSFLEMAPSALYCSLRKVTSPASFSFGLQMIVQYR